MRSLLVGTLRLYQLVISPLLPKACRFYPSCSEYAILAIRRDGAWPGAWIALMRFARCNPWHPGGVDFLPELPSGPAPQAR
jgi:uncharacterized protein